MFRKINLRLVTLMTAISIFYAPVFASPGDLTFQGLGFLPGGTIDSFAYGISADGRVVVGSSESGIMYMEAFRWTAEEGMVGLGDLLGGGDDSYAQAVSGDGSVIVGGSSGEFPNGDNDIQPFKWTKSDGMVSLGGLSDYWGGLARGVSDDGKVIVGHSVVSQEGDYKHKGFKWTETSGMVSLGTLMDGNGRSEAWGVSSDGEVIVGRSNAYPTGDDYYDYYSCFWKSSEGVRDLNGFQLRSCATAVSADGSVVIGYNLIGGWQAFYWTAEEGMILLGSTINGKRTYFANDVSADGKIIVGDTPNDAFIWDKDNGARLLQDVLKNEQGLELTGWKLKSARGISADGKTIVGYGINPAGKNEAWIVTPKVDLGNLIGLVIEGPNQVQERSVTYYKAVACYDSGMKREISRFATFWLESNTYAAINNDGSLCAKEIKTPQEVVIHSEYTIDGVSYQAQKPVTVSFYVPIYVPDDYETIKEAILHAKNGDIIIVRDGRYSGQGNRNLRFGNRKITVRSENGPENCIIDCESQGGAFTFFDEGTDATVEGFTITNAYSAIYCSSSYENSMTNPTIRNCIFINNWGTIYNDCRIEDAVTSPTITNCIFIGNFESAIFNETFLGITSLTITNCTFIDNPDGVINNIQNLPFGRIDVLITNCILWNNASNITGEPDTVTISYSCIQGGYNGIGNIDTDPLFVNPSCGDYHLLPASPCIDKGDPCYIAEVNEMDMEGNRRITNDRIDMGCYEFYNISDLNGDGIVNFVDFSILSIDFKKITQSKYPGDIIGENGLPDGYVNCYDLMLFAENWLWTSD